MRMTHASMMGDVADTGLADGSANLVVTPPPYLMIEMWDDLFSARDDVVDATFDAGDGSATFEAMHEQLDAVWDEVARVLAPGGIACVNVGDAAWSLDGSFRQYLNHTRALTALGERGLTPSPDVAWRKPTNRLTKLMGSGMPPTNTYVTLEHEYVLVARKGDPRPFPSGDDRRYESAFFWEGRNRRFSDFREFNGTDQHLDSGVRERLVAFPVKLPLRLIRMYSVYGDIAFDPLVGTGTTALAAMPIGRGSVGYGLDADSVPGFERWLDDLPERPHAEVERRLDAHHEFVVGCDEPPSHDAEHYDSPVVTKQEHHICLYRVLSVEALADGASREFAVEHELFDGTETAVASECSELSEDATTAD